MNLYTVGADRWQGFPTWPVPGTRYTPYYLDPAKSGSANSVNDGSLSATQPAKASADVAPLLPASSPCSRLTAQWTAGFASGPCETDNRSFEATSLTYTTKPLESDTELTVSADLWAELSSTDATLVAVLSDVDPSGQSTQVTAGFLLASQRAVDLGKSTIGPGGLVIRPYHPFTRESQKPVTPNDPERYQVEIYPTSQVFKKGHRLRLTIATANTPTTATPVPDMANETGTIRTLSGPRYPSRVILPMRGAAPAAPARTCRSPRAVVLRFPGRVTSVRVYVNGRRVKSVRGRQIRRVRVSHLPSGRFTLKTVATQANGKRTKSLRKYPRC